MGKYLESQLRERLEQHQYVGDIRGRGLFWAVEFVEDKMTKTPFDARLSLAKRLSSKGLERGYDVSLFAATGVADGWLGDHFLLAPPFTVTEADVREIVERVVKVVDSVFEDLEREGLMVGAAGEGIGYTNGTEDNGNNVNGHLKRKEINGVDEKILNASGPDEAVSDCINGHSNGIKA